VRSELTARFTIPLVEAPRVAEFDRVTGPKRAQVHGHGARQHT
jgi:hypothetical protein